MRQILCSDWLDWPSLFSQENWIYFLHYYSKLRQQDKTAIKKNDKSCVTNETLILFEKNLPQTSSSFKQISFCKRPKKINSWPRITTAHESNSPVIFVTHKYFAILFLLPSLLHKRNIINAKRNLTGTWPISSHLDLALGQ